MRHLVQLALTVTFVALATAQLLGQDSPPQSNDPELDPLKVFQLACDRLKNLEAKHGELNGVSKIKPRLQWNDKKELKSAGFVFELNSIPPGKNPAKAKDESKPFFFVSVQVWSGHSQQPPGDLQAFKWKGEEYEAWVQVYGSDAELVKAIRKAVAVPIIAPTPKK